MMASTNDIDTEIQALEEYPERWPVRRRLVERMLNQGQGTRAAEVIWRAPTIPQEPAELAWALTVLGGNMPRRAVRLVHAVIEQHAKRPAMLVRVADALEKAGYGLQAARFYGVAQQLDPALTDAEFESGLLSLDAAGTAAAGIAGKGEVIGVLNWVPGGGNGGDREDKTPAIGQVDRSESGKEDNGSARAGAKNKADPAPAPPQGEKPVDVAKTAFGPGVSAKSPAGPSAGSPPDSKPGGAPAPPVKTAPPAKAPKPLESDPTKRRSVPNEHSGMVHVSSKDDHTQAVKLKAPMDPENAPKLRSGGEHQVPVVKSEMEPSAPRTLRKPSQPSGPSGPPKLRRLSDPPPAEPSGDD